MNDLNDSRNYYLEPMDRVIIRETYRKILDYCVGDVCLDLGCADGFGTSHLVDKFTRIIAVDGSSERIASAETKYPHPKISYLCIQFENLIQPANYMYHTVTADTIILAHVMEYVSNPKEIIEIAKSILSPHGRIIIVITNAQSIHRQLGYHMGIIPSLSAFSERNHGYQRIYSPQLITDEVEKAGLDVIAKGGALFKPFHNAIMNKIIGTDDIESGLVALGNRYPELSSEYYVACEK